jgi:hypothetical protein
MPNTITLKDEGRAFRKEGEASAAITPGHLIEFGGGEELRVHSTVGGAARRAFALENDLIGKGPLDAYAANDIVQYGVFPPGAEVWAITSEAVNKGDFLESAGDGRLQVSSTPVAISQVAVALGTIGAAGRVAVEVL